MISGINLAMAMSTLKETSIVYLVSVALKVPQNAISWLRVSIFKIFQEVCSQTPLALYVCMKQYLIGQAK